MNNDTNEKFSYALGANPQNTSGDNSSSQTIADVLLSEHAITVDQYKDIKVKSASENKSVDEIVTSGNFVSEEKLAEARAKLLAAQAAKLADKKAIASAIAKKQQTAASAAAVAEASALRRAIMEFEATLRRPVGVNDPRVQKLKRHFLAGGK